MEIEFSPEGEDEDTEGGDEDAEDVVARDAFAEQDSRKNRCNERTGGEECFCNRGTIEGTIGEGLQQIIEEGLTKTRDEEYRQVGQLHFLQTKKRMIATNKADEKHQQYGRYEPHNDHCERRQNEQGVLDGDTADRPNEH